MANETGNTIPKHWQSKKLGEACKVVTGTTPSKSNKDFYGTEYPFYKPTDLEQGISTTFARDSLTKLGLDNGRFLPKNSILVTCIGATIGKTGLIKKEGSCNQQINAILPNEGFDSSFLYYQITSEGFQREIKSNAASTTLPILNKSKFEKLKVIIPPLPEQRAIVSKIEELFSELDNGKQQLLTAQQQLKVYRQSLLNSILKKSSLKTIESVSTKLDQGWSPKCLNQNSLDKNEWAVIKTSAVQHGQFLQDENKILPLNLKPREQHELRAGDILITRAGPRIRVGVCCMVKKVRPRLINCDKVYRIRVNYKIISPEYFEIILNTPTYLRQIEEMKTGINDSGLNLTQNRFLKIEIPVPSLNEQDQIVQDLESKLTVCDKIEEIISQSLQQAETLRQSILKKAFEGKLVAALKKHPTLLEESAPREEPVQAPKGRDTQTMGTAHRNESRVSSKALKGRNNLNLKK